MLIVLLTLERRGRQRGQGGFTLIEVMIAMLLLLIGVAGVLSLQMVSVRATSFSRHATEATIVAEDKMEELMTMGTTSPLFIDGTDDVDEMSRTDGNDEYTREWVLIVDPADVDITIVNVIVSWTERGIEPHSITLTGKRRL